MLKTLKVILWNEEIKCPRKIISEITSKVNGYQRNTERVLSGKRTFKDIGEPPIIFRESPTSFGNLRKSP